MKSISNCLFSLAIDSCDTPADEARMKLASGIITLQEARSIIDNHLAVIATHGSDEDKTHLTHIVNQWRREVYIYS